MRTQRCTVTRRSTTSQSTGTAAPARCKRHARTHNKTTETEQTFTKPVAHFYPASTVLRITVLKHKSMQFGRGSAVLHLTQIHCWSKMYMFSK